MNVRGSVVAGAIAVAGLCTAPAAHAGLSVTVAVNDTVVQVPLDQAVDTGGLPEVSVVATAAASGGGRRGGGMAAIQNTR